LIAVALDLRLKRLQAPAGDFRLARCCRPWGDFLPCVRRPNVLEDNQGSENAFPQVP